MYKTCIFLDEENLAVIDETGCPIKRENEENIEEILNNENNLETLNKLIMDKNKQLSNAQNNKKKSKNILIQIVVIGLLSIPTLILLISLMLEVSIGALLSTSLIKELIISIALVESILFLGALPNFLIYKNKANKIQKNRKYLEEQKKIVVSKLKELYKGKNRKVEYLSKDLLINIPKGIRITTLDTEKYLYKIKLELLLLEEYRRHKNKYKKLCKDGTLEKYLKCKKDYSEDRIEFIKNLIVKELVQEDIKEENQIRMLYLNK